MMSQNIFVVSKRVGHITYLIVRKLNASHCGIERRHEGIAFFLDSFITVAVDQCGHYSVHYSSVVIGVHSTRMKKEPNKEINEGKE